MKQVLSILTLSILSLSINSCTTSKSEDVADAKKEVNAANEKLIEAQRVYEEDVADYRAEVAADIHANELLIAQMKAKNSSIDKAIRAEREKMIDELEKKNNELSAKVKNYKNDSREDWYNFKKELKHDMTELGQSFSDMGKDNVADKK